MKIKALRTFSHYHLGTVSQGEVRVVKKEYGDALVKMLLAEEIEPEKVKSPEQDSRDKPKGGGKSGSKRSSDGADKEASES